MVTMISHSAALLGGSCGVQAGPRANNKTVRNARFRRHGRDHYEHHHHPPHEYDDDAIIVF